MTRRESPASSGDGQVTLCICQCRCACSVRSAMGAQRDDLGDVRRARGRPVPRLTKIAVSASLCSAALGAKLLSPAQILRSSAGSPMGMTALPTKQGSMAWSTR